MFSFTIFKQTLKQNWKLWAIFTLLTAIIASVFIGIYDPQTMQGMTDILESSGLASMMGNRVDELSSLLGLLGANFYGGVLGCILPIIYVIMTCNTLIASQIDRGSMAYVLSTPIKRSKVVLTQAIYMIGSLLLMYVVVVLIGLGTVQVFHHGLWGENYTDDIVKISEESGKSEDYLEHHMYEIYDDDSLLRIGASARDIDNDVYKAYVHLVMDQQANEEIAQILDIDVDDVENHYDEVLTNNDALKAAADIYHISSDEYKALLQQKQALQSQQSDIQKQLLVALNTGAQELDIEQDEISDHLDLLKNDATALKKASQASGLSEDMLTQLINQQLAYSQLSMDEGFEFDVQNYLMLNVGAFLLMLAYSGISFMFSCIFNLTKYSLTFGAGIPVGSLLLFVMSTTSSDLEFLKYCSLNTLFDTTSIVNGSYDIIGFVILLVISIILYVIGCEVFKRKDLPL